MLSLVFALLAAGPGGPAATHDIAGHVADSAGTGLANVRVVVLEAGRATLTDGNGRYRIRNLGDGDYRISFALIGFAPAIRRVTIVGTDVALDVQLKRSLIELPALQVTASPNATSVLSSPQPTAVVAGDDLRESQAPSLGETLRTLPGVRSLSTGVGIGKPMIRGLTSNRVLILDGGQRMETQQWGDEHGPNIETATAERIEVIKGPATVLYGSDALGGVINVVPRDLPTADPGRTAIHGSVSAAYGSNNRSPDGSALLEGARGGFGFRAALSGRSSKDLKTSDYALWNSGNEALAGSGALGYHGGWGLVAASFSRRNEKISLTDEDPAATPTQRITSSRGRVDLTVGLGRSHLDGDVGYERNRRREFKDNETNKVALGLLSTTWTGGLRLHHASLGPLNGVVGVSGLRTTFGKFGAETLVPNSVATTAGIFGFEQIETGPWNFSFGARLDHRKLDVENDDELGVTAQSRTYNSATGNLGVLLHVSEPVALVLNVGRGYRAPSTFDLFSNGVHEGTVAFERGNPNLKNETSFNTDVGVRLQSGRAFLDVGAFANRISNFIYTVPTGTTDPGSGFEIYGVTQGNATLTGIEAAIQYHPAEWIHLQGSADYTRGQNTTTAAPLPLMPPFRTTYSVRFEGKSHGALAAPYLLVGGESNAKQTRLEPAEAAFYAAAFKGAGYQSQGYTLANLGAGVGVVTSGNVVRVSLSLRNAFNARYADFLSRIKTIAPNPGMGRNLTIRLSTDF